MYSGVNVCTICVRGPLGIVVAQTRNRDSVGFRVQGLACRVYRDRVHRTQGVL